MTQQEFELLFNLQIERCKELLVRKSAEYATDKNRMKNFIDGGAYLNCSPEMALLAYLTKHLISIRDMIISIEEGKSPALNQWEEKITDALNYLFLLDALYRREEN